jgi:hypothetical protein
MSYQSTCQKKPYDDNFMRSNSPKFTNQIGCCLGYILTLTDEQLYQLDINPSGEYHHCTTADNAKAVCSHIQPMLLSKGFACYVLDSSVWIVPFVHSEIHLPDFQRAKTVLPVPAEKLLKVSSNHVSHQIEKPDCHCNRQGFLSGQSNTLKSLAIWLTATSVVVIALHLLG